jgi:predicted amidohydrolase
MAPRVPRLPDTFRVALAQMSHDWSRHGAVQENLAKAKEWVKEAARQKARAIMFSEYFLGDMAVSPLPNEAIKELQGQARRSRICVVCGVTRNRVQEKPRQQFVTSVVIGRRGEIVGMVNKSVYYPSERPWFDAAEPGGPVEVDGVLVGVLAGFDAALPELARGLVERGAEVLMMQLSSFSQEERLAMRSVAIARAFENTVPVASVGLVGEFMKRQGVGGSIAVAPRTQRFGVTESSDGVIVLFEAGDEETLAVVEFDLRALRAVRKRFSIRPTPARPGEPRTDGTAPQ